MIADTTGWMHGPALSMATKQTHPNAVTLTSMAAHLPDKAGDIAGNNVQGKHMPR